VILKVDENTKLEIGRSAISTVAAEGKTEKIEKNEKAEAEEKKGEGTSETRNADTAEKSGN
jgi:hypothetical protein